MAVFHTRLLEDAVKSEDAVEFKIESLGQDLVERLFRARRSAYSTSSTSHVVKGQGAGRREDVSFRDQKREHVDKDDKTSSKMESCTDHPEVLLEYWCEDDSRLVCKNCLIFGEHKGHTAITVEQRRSTGVMDRLGSLLPSLQDELKMIEKTCRHIEMEWKDQFNLVMAEVERWLDDAYVQEKRKVISPLSDHSAKLQQTISSIHSHQAGLFSPTDQAVPNPDTVSRLVSDSIRLHILPGRAVRQDSSLVLSHPSFRLTGGDEGNSSSDLDTSISMVTNISMVTQSPPTSSPLQLGTSTPPYQPLVGWTGIGQSHSNTKIPKIKPFDIITLDGATVTVMKNGTPGQFYCQLAGDISMECKKVEELLVDMTFESRIFPPNLGQGVLVRWDGKWCRATVLEGLSTGWRCELVDLGQVVEVVTLEIADIPLSVLETPAMSACCTLDGVKDKDWTEEARLDWEKLISGQQFLLHVEDQTSSSVHLVQGKVEMLDKLQFLGHLPGVDTVRPGQHFSPPADLSTAASLCCDYNKISPDLMLLYFDNPLLHHQLQLLAELDTLPHLVSPGYVQPGHALLAPWTGSLFRATVLAVSGTTLTVLYVDFGNTDIVSWWDCAAVPRHLLFPSLATQVRLAGVRSVGEGGWTREGRHRLKEVLNKTSKNLEVTVVRTDKVLDGILEVELFVRDGGCPQNVGQLLIEEGYAFESDVGEDDHQVSPLHLSNRSSQGSSGEMMSNFLVGEEKKFTLDQTDMLQHQGLLVDDDQQGVEVVVDAESTYLVYNVDNNKDDVREDWISHLNHTIKDGILEPHSSATVAEDAVEVAVLHVDSPDQVWVRLACDKDRWTQFHQDLQETGNNIVGMGSGAKLETGQKVLCRVEGAWYRGSVFKVDLDKVCQVKLVDLGVVAKVGMDNVRKLEQSSIVRENLFARSVGLSGIEPAGSGGWSASSVDFLTSLTKKRKVILVKKDDESEDLMVEEISANNPLDVETVIRISLVDILLERGLALKKDTRNKCARNWTGFVNVDMVDDENTDIEDFKKDEITVEKNSLCDLGNTSSLNRRLSFSQVPQLPAKQVFTAMLMNIDCSAVVWVIPKTDSYVLSEMEVELASCTDPALEIITGMLVVAKLRGNNVRGRVLEVEGEEVRLIDIDSGEVFLSVTQALCQVCPSLLYRPPLAIPLKLYGVRKTTSALCETGRAAVLDIIREKSSSPLWCNVSLLEKNTKNFPLPAIVRYMLVKEYDGNLALDLVEVGLCEVITKCSQWEKEVSDHGLEWMLDPMSVPVPLAFLPHPLPMAVGQWLQITVEGLEFQEPGLDNPDANIIGVHIKPLDSRASFDQHQQDISSSLRTIFPQVQKLSTAFNEDRISLAISASTAQLVPSPSVGQCVLAYYPLEEGGEWCRGVVETVQSKEVVTVHYTDYGHKGQVEARHLRSMNYQERMKPVQVKEVVFRIPESNSELEVVRKLLGREEVNLTEERLLMRVEKITPLGHRSEVEMTLVSVWRAVVGKSSLSFKLSRIC